jgi:hypothetical protein
MLFVTTKWTCMPKFRWLSQRLQRISQSTRSVESQLRYMIEISVKVFLLNFFFLVFSLQLNQIQSLHAQVFQFFIYFNLLQVCRPWHFYKVTRILKFVPYKEFEVQVRHEARVELPSSRVSTWFRYRLYNK